MLQRSKAKEAELLDKISELESDLSAIDQEKDQAIATADQAKQRLAQVQRDFEQLLEQATLLEKEGASFRQREADLLRESKDRSTVHSKLEEERVKLQSQVDDLKREVTQKEEAVKRAKERADQNTVEMDKRLQLEKSRS
jgi:myosin protein heavy chain